MQQLWHGHEGMVSMQHLSAAISSKPLWPWLTCFCLVQFQTFEVQRCIEAKEGQQFVMNTCVMTTATYGEKFRPCFKYT